MGEGSLSMAEPIIRIRGERVHLALMRTDDEALRTYMRWMSDEGFNAWINQSSNVLSLEGEREWASRCHPQERRFNIIDASTHDLLGNASVRLGDAGASAVLGIVIGEGTGRDRGCGTEVVRMLRDFSFMELRAHRAELSVMDDNLRARRCYEKAGFRECGRRHEALWYHGAWHDSIDMEILYDEWLGLRGAEDAGS